MLGDGAYALSPSRPLPLVGAATPTPALR